MFHVHPDLRKNIVKRLKKLFIVVFWMKKTGFRMEYVAIVVRRFQEIVIISSLAQFFDDLK
jgi:hypothetical protein